MAIEYHRMIRSSGSKKTHPKPVFQDWNMEEEELQPWSLSLTIWCFLGYLTDASIKARYTLRKAKCVTCWKLWYFSWFLGFQIGWNDRMTENRIVESMNWCSTPLQDSNASSPKNSKWTQLLFAGPSDVSIIYMSSCPFSQLDHMFGKHSFPRTIDCI